MRQNRQLSVKQLEGIDSIEAIMRANEIGMADVREHYKDHAPKPVRVRLTNAQRLGIKQILKLIKIHRVTSDELAEIYDCAESQDGAQEDEQISQASVTETVEAQSSPAQIGEGEPKQQVQEQAEAEAEASAQTSNEPAMQQQPLITHATQEQAVAQKAEPSMDDPALAEKAMMDMLAEWKAGRKGRQVSWNMPSAVSQLGEAEAQGGKAHAAEGKTGKQFGRRPGDTGYVKYRHPYTLRTWDGKGEMPQWLKESLLDEGMAKKHFIPVENFPLEQETAGLPAGVPFEALAIQFNLKQKPLVS